MKDKPRRNRLCAAGSMPYVMRVTPEQRAKIDRMGGAKWVRGLIDAARSTGKKEQQK